MIENPFTPIFGGKPRVFFGRKGILEGFENALRNTGSDYRALFITGSRGYGKTALLEQLSRRAEKAGWTTVDVGPKNPIGNIMRHIVPYDEATKTIEPELGVTVFGTGGSLRGGSSTKTIRYDIEDFEYVFMDYCRRKKPKLFISVDEIQKVSLEDVSAISNVFQMASRKGYDVMLAVAGLPQSHAKVVRQEGCTFMRRATHVVLGPLSRAEISGAFEDVFLSLNGITLSDEAVKILTDASYGHPYVMQLEGYYLVEWVRKQGDSFSGVVSGADVKSVLPTIVSMYESRAMQPLVEELPKVEREYLFAMARALDENRSAKTRDIARLLGKEQNRTSQAREYLLAGNIVYSPRRGELVFAIPYLADYLLKYGALEEDGLKIVGEWKM